VDGLQTVILLVGSAVLGFATIAIAWRELRPGADVAYVQSWRDIFGVVTTVSGIGALLAWLWITL
jgi:hypothetical protein